MSICSYATKQDLNNLRNLVEQQKIQRALKIKNRILKQTHDRKLAESLSAITKKIDEVKRTTQKLGAVVKENNTPQLVIENTHNALPVEKEQIQPRVFYDKSLENTLNIMKMFIGFMNIEESDKDDIIWNGFPVEKVGDNKLKFIEKICDKIPGFQKVLTDKSNILVKKLNDQDREIIINFLQSFDIENYKAISGEVKSGRINNLSPILKNVFWKVKDQNLSYHLT